MSKVFTYKYAGGKTAKSEINVFPLGNAVYIDLFDTGEGVIKMGNKKFFLLHDNTFGQDTFHKDTSKTHKHPGIRPRWARVIAVNEESEEIVQIGDRVLVDTLKWSAPCPLPGHTNRKFYRVAVEDIMGIDTKGFKEDEIDDLKERRTGVGYWIMKKGKS